MKITIRNKEFDVGWKTYVAWCSNIYKDGILDRYETNKRLLEIKLDPQFVSFFLARYFGNSQSDTLNNILSLTSYQFLYSMITTPINLGVVCLYVSRSNDIPNKHKEFRKNRREWFYKLIEESIQYPTEDKLCTNYLSNIEGNLVHYISLAKFCPDIVISNNDIAEEFNVDLGELNSIDECGWLIRLNDSHFVWSDSNIRLTLCNYNYRDLTWALYNKLVRNINKQRFS